MNNTAILSVCAAGLAATVFAANPILPLWECIPDGEPHVFEDPDNPGMMRVYLYGSHDNRVVSYCGRDQVVWSASVDDLNKWRFDGVAFRSIYGADGKQLNKNGLGDIRGDSTEYKREEFLKRLSEVFEQHKRIFIDRATVEWSHPEIVDAFNVGRKAADKKR